MVNDDITQIYRRLIVNRIDSSKFLLLHYSLTASDGLKLSDAVLRTLLILTRRTLRQKNNEEDITIKNYGAVLTNKSLNNIVHGEVTLAIPLKYIDKFDPVTSIYLLAASASEYGYCKDAWLMDVDLPDSILNNISGPKYGIKGIRRKLQVFDRPIVAVSLQRLYTGTTKQELIDFVSECIEGGIDLIVDDILNNNNDFEYSIFEKAQIISELIEKHNSNNHKNIGYFIYLNCFGKTAEEVFTAVNTFDVLGVIVNSFLMSYGYLQNEMLTYFKSDNKPIISCTNMGSSMLGRNPMDEDISDYENITQNPRTGISEIVTAKLSRIIGADAVHTGTAGAECWHPAEFNMSPHTLVDKIPNISPSMSIAEGDLPISEMGANIKYLGEDVIFEISSGIGLHPSGPKEGSKAYRILSGCIHQNMTVIQFESALVFLSNKYACIRQSLDYEGWKPKEIKVDASQAKKILKASPWSGDFKL